MNADRSSGIHRVVSDVVDLALLQLQLFAVDGREAGRRGFGAALYLGLAAALLVSTATVALFGFGWVLHEAAGWPLGWSLLGVAAVALLLILAILGLAYLSLKKAAAAMHDVGTEFAENVEWLRAVVASPTPRRPPSASGFAGSQPSDESDLSSFGPSSLGASTARPPSEREPSGWRPSQAGTADSPASEHPASTHTRF